ncbi:MAG: B12-binding domain-containing radical SAM protein, partial [bacterium]
MSKVKCILIDPPDIYQKQGANQRTQMHEVYPPLGLLYIAAILEQSGIDIRLIEARSRGLSPQEVVEIIEKENPQFVAITAITASINSALYLSAKVKEISPDIKVILGGPHIHFQHKTIIDNPSVDFCVRDEGELTTLELISSLLNGDNLAQVKGITFKQGNVVIAAPDRSFVEDLDELPFPARGLLHHPAYRGGWTGGRPFTSVLATRGCPYHCQFCASPAIWGRRHRRRSVANVLDELEEICQKFGVRYVRFVDDLLLVNKRWTI